MLLLRWYYDEFVFRLNSFIFTFYLHMTSRGVDDCSVSALHTILIIPVELVCDVVDVGTHLVYDFENFTRKYFGRTLYTL